MPNQLLPGWARHNSAWPPKWTAKWTPLTDATFMLWLAFLILLAQQHPPSCMCPDTQTDERQGGQDRAHVPSGLS
eukprot:2291699-Rhodomonas_salina.1